MAANWTNSQVVAQLNSGQLWSGATITYAFPSSASGMYSQGEAAAFLAANGTQQALFTQALQTWDDLIAPNFQFTTATNSNIEFGYTTTNIEYAHAYYPTTGSVWFNSSEPSLTSPTIESYGFQTLIHELGHTLGLNHMGNYNGAGAHTPSSFQDSVVLSVMSYFGPRGAAPLVSAEVMDADWSGPDGVVRSAQTPMLNDVLAIQTMYGASTATRTGDTVYGFSSNITGTAGNIYDFTRNPNPILTLFDSGGSDTLNLSGWSTPSFVYLESGVYSSCNSMTNNIVIAYSCVIENAIGGGGNDQLTGNGAGNRLDGGSGNDVLSGGSGADTLIGGTGNDTLYGGADDDTAVFSGTFSSYTVTYSATSGGIYTIAGTDTGSDMVSGVEFFQFSDTMRTASQLVAADVTPPTLTSLLPADNATGVSPGANLVLTFNESVQAGTGNFVLFNANGTVARTIAAGDTSQVAFAANTVTINPLTDLAFNSGYYLNFAAGVVKDVSGNNFAGLTGAAAYNFTTVAAADDFPANTSTGGTVVVNGAAVRGVIETTGDVDYFRVSLTAGVSYAFSATRTAGGLSDPYLDLYGPAAQQLASDNESGGSGNARITFTPVSSGTYYLGVSNAFGSGTGTGAYTVSAALNDVTAPTLTSALPVDNSTAVSPSANLVLTFSEDVQAGVGNFTIYNASGTVARTIAAGDTSQVTIAGSTVTVNPLADLAFNSSYYVNVAPGAIKDLAGNNFAGISGATAYNFATAAAADDFPWDTGTSGVVTVNGAATGGVIGVAGDLDLFRVTLNAGSVYVFDLARTPGGLTDPYLVLYNPSIQLVAFDDDGGGSLNARITYTATTSGTYYLGAYDSHSTGIGAYTISAATLADDFPWATNTSGVVTVNGPASIGAIESVGDQDLFKVTLTAGIAYVFDLTGMAGGLSDPFLELYNPSVVRVAFDDDSGELLNARITYTPTSSGTYYLGAYGANGVETGAYTISAITLADDFPWATNTSGVVTVNGTATGGVIGVAGDLDLFKVTLTAGSVYVFNLTRTTGGLTDPYLVLYNPSVQLVASDDDGGENLNARITYTATTSGTYYLGAYDTHTTGTGAYTVSATTLVDDFPWATNTSGVVIVNGAATTGTIESGGDLDLFKVTLTAGTAYVFDLARTAGGLTDPYLVLYSPTVALVAFDDDSGGSLNARITYTPTTSGTYYLGAYDTHTTGTGAYAITAKIIDATPPALSGSAPSDNATGVLPDADLVFSFSEAVQAGVGNFDIYNANGTIARSISASDSSQVSFAGNTVTVNPAVNLGFSSNYYVNIAAGVVRDLAGNSFAGISGPTAYNFSTAAAGFTDDFPWSTSTNGVVSVNGLPTSGAINAVDDQDMFKVTLAAGTTNVFNLTRTSGGLSDPYLTLYGPTVELISFDNNSGGSGNARITYTAVATGVYYLGAEDFGTGTGGYTISAANVGTSGNDTLIGTAANDFLLGLAGNDTLDGGAGADSMSGGTGNDTYLVDDSGDLAIENLNEGTDLVLASASYTLPDNVENLSLSGSTNIDGTGNILKNVITGNSGANNLTGGAGNDTLIGNAGNDTLDGGLGVDRMEGGAGDDTYIVDRAATTSIAADGSVLTAPGDVVFEGTATNDSGGTDTVRTTLKAYTLGVNVENLAFIGTGNFVGTGNALNNQITGGAGNDTLSGGAGNDVLVVSAGNDTFAGGAGLDTLDLSALAFSFAEKGVPGGFSVGRPDASTIVITDLDSLQKFTVKGPWGAITGDRGIESYHFSDQTVTLTDLIANTASAFGDTYTGTDANDVFDGLAGNDTIDGGAGNDLLTGGTGNDTYVVDSLSDTVIELPGQGVDVVKTGLAGYTLGNNLEQLLFTGAGNFIGVGNGLANRITGGAGDDTLDGGLGADTLVGGAGDDTYYVDRAATTSVLEDGSLLLAPGDVVNEGTAAADSGGTDTVNASVSYTLGTNVENLVLTGSLNLSGTGNTLANALTGNDGNNVLSGADGNDALVGGLGNDTLKGGNGDDVLLGGAGNDRLVGGAGADQFDFTSVLDAASNIDTIADFQAGDLIRLESDVFQGLTVGSLDANAFHSAAGATQALEADDRIVYNTTTGALYFDADGSGSAAQAVQFAVLSTHPAQLSAADFSVI